MLMFVMLFWLIKLRLLLVYMEVLVSFDCVEFILVWFKLLIVFWIDLVLGFFGDELLMLFVFFCFLILILLKIDFLRFECLFRIECFFVGGVLLFFVLRINLFWFLFNFLFLFLIISLFLFLLWREVNEVCILGW